MLRVDSEQACVGPATMYQAWAHFPHPIPGGAHAVLHSLWLPYEYGDAVSEQVQSGGEVDPEILLAAIDSDPRNYKPVQHLGLPATASVIRMCEAPAHAYTPWGGRSCGVCPNREVIARLVLASAGQESFEMEEPPYSSVGRYGDVIDSTGVFLRQIDNPRQRRRRFSQRTFHPLVMSPMIERGKPQRHNYAILTAARTSVYAALHPTGEDTYLETIVYVDSTGRRLL